MLLPDYRFIVLQSYCGSEYWILQIMKYFNLLDTTIDEHASRLGEFEHLQQSLLYWRDSAAIVWSACGREFILALP